MNRNDKLGETYKSGGEDNENSWVGYFSTFDLKVFIKLDESEQLPDRDDMKADPTLTGCVNYEAYTIVPRRRYARNIGGGYFLYNADSTFGELCDFIMKDIGYIIDKKVIGKEKDKVKDQMDYW